MIGFLKGTVFSREGDTLLLDVGGVGYELFMPERDMQQLPAPGGDAFVFVHTAFREDAITLFGFASLRRRELFRVLIDVSGVGPRLAMNVLSGMSSNDLLLALARGETASLQAVHGVGKKTAARLCVDLRDRATKLLEYSGFEKAVQKEAPPSAVSSQHASVHDAVSALVNLGWKENEATKAVTAVIREFKDADDIQVLITRAMSRLSNFR